MDRMEEPSVKTRHLPRTDQELDMLVSAKFKPEDLEEESENGSTSSECQVERKGGSSRSLRRRPRRVLQSKVDQIMSGAQLGMTFLEVAAISTRARENYKKKWAELLELARQKRVDVDDAQSLDIMLVDHFNAKYLEGEGAHYGDYMMAALMDMKPSYSRVGDKKVPRCWRALKGWRKLCPPRSRLSYPLAVWAALSWRMVVHGHLMKALFNLLQVSTYHRPGTLLKLRKMGLVRPTAGVTPCWSMVTSLEETSDVSKVGTKDDSILLDSDWLNFAQPLFEVLVRGRPMDRVWKFNYGEYLAVFRKCAEELKIPVVPYQARHSGPSMDRAAKVRDLDEVRRRGGWMTRKSVMRYEQAGRLAATWQKLPPETQSVCKSAERYLAEILLGHPYPNIQLPK